MITTQAHKLTAQFYNWEERGRGWHVFEEAVCLEPGFEPFIFHLPLKQPAIDDGRHPGILEKLATFLSPKKEEPEIPEEECIIEAFPYEPDAAFHIMRVAFPVGTKIRAEETEQLLLMLSNCSFPVSFEIAATSEKISIQYTCAASEVRHLKNQLKAYFPLCVLTEQGDALFESLQDEVYILDLGLSNEFMRPLSMQGGFDPDPFISLFGILENLPPAKSAGVQVLFQGCENPWTESIIRAVSMGQNDAFFENAPDMVPFAKQKISAPLFGVVLRAIGSADTEHEAYDMAWDVAETVVHLSRSPGNQLLPLSNDEYFSVEHLEDVLYRRSHRTGMLLNSKELATLVHYPSASVNSSKLERDTKKTKAAPALAQGNQFLLGTNSHQGKEIAVSVSNEQRLKHTHIIGATGTGKSTLLLNMIVQDIEEGTGCAVLDPHGDLIEKILAYIPKQRIKDVLVIDPADAEFPVGFNILSAHSEIEKDILSSDLVAAFKRLSTSWGDQMNSVFANAILAFLENTKGGTLADLRRFLIEKSFRDSILKTVTDPSVLYYWQKEYPLLRSNSIGSILTRLDSFLRPKLIRNMVCQKKSIDFDRLMNEKKIILVKLSQGLIGAENSFLLGTFIVAKLQQAAMARQATAQELRSDFFLYVDEFQHFITPSMSTILSGTRKYHLGLILAHQSMQQIGDAEIASSIIANAGTSMCFRLGETDARKLEDGFSFFDSKDLQNLSTGEAVARIEKPEFDFSLQTSQRETSSIPEEVQQQIIAYSRQAYGTEKHVVEAYLVESMQLPVQEERQQTIPKPLSTEIKQEVPMREQKQPSAIQTLIPEPVPEETSPKKIVPSQHTYLKNLIKKMAEDRGYKATLEEATPDGKGKVDVGLLRNEKRIACEISVTTGDAWEVQNIEKCLAAGYETIIVCSTDRRNLEKIQKLVHEKFDTSIQSKVLTLVPEQLFLYLDQQIAQEANTEERVKGYRVTVEYKAVPQEAAKQKREHIIKTILDSVRKNKKQP